MSTIRGYRCADVAPRWYLASREGAIRRCSRTSRATTSGTCRCASRSRAAHRSVRSTRCARRCATRRRNGDDPGTLDFLQSWVAMADKLVGLADEDAAAGHGFAAADKLDRAALYFQIAERMQAHGSPGADGRVRQGARLRSPDRSSSAALPVERVEIPYLDGVIPGWFRRADRGNGPRPTIVYVNGLDSTKEMLVWSFLGDELARRGVNTLHIDQPGTGEALRRHDLTATPGCEWGTAGLSRPSPHAPMSTPGRVGIAGISLGGYYAPRALVTEPRFALGAVWGANHNWGEVQRRRLENEGERPVPHYWEHVRWVWGAGDMDEFLALCPSITLDGLLDQVTVPFLVTHGENDRQIPARLRAPDVRPARQQPQARAEDLRRPHRRCRARERRQHDVRPPLHRRLDRRDVRRDHGPDRDGGPHPRPGRSHRRCGARRRRQPRVRSAVRRGARCRRSRPRREARRAIVDRSGRDRRRQGPRLSGDGLRGTGARPASRRRSAVLRRARRRCCRRGSCPCRAESSCATPTAPCSARSAVSGDTSDNDETCAVAGIDAAGLVADTGDPR